MRALDCLEPRPKSEISTWDKADKDGNEIEPMREAKSVSGDAQITNMANKTEHKCG